MASDTRRNFSAAVKRAAWQRCNGRCQDCTAPVAAGGFIYDHIVPWELTRDSSLGNCQVLCLSCDDDKTYGRDIPMIAAADRKADFHLGVSGPGRGRCPLPCGQAFPIAWCAPPGGSRRSASTTATPDHTASGNGRGLGR